MQKKTTRETSNRGRSSAAPVQGGGTRGNRRSERRTNVPSETRRPMKKRRIGTVVMSSSVNAKKKKVDRVSAQRSTGTTSKRWTRTERPASEVRVPPIPPSTSHVDETDTLDLTCKEGQINDGREHTIRDGTGYNDTHDQDGYGAPPNTEHSSDRDTPEQPTRPRHDQVRTVQLDRADMVIEKDAWVSVKGELGRAKSELVRLDAHVALLNKCNDRLERECEELKATVATLRLKNKDRETATATVDNASSVFRAGRYRRQMGYNSEELHGMFKDEGVQLTFHPCFVEVYMRMFHLAKHTTTETTWETLFCQTLNDQTDMGNINKKAVTDWRGFMVEASHPPSEVTDNTEPSWHSLVVAKRKVGNVTCYYIPECFYSRHKTGPFYVSAAQVLNRALYEFMFIHMCTSAGRRESVTLSTVKEEVAKSDELQRRLRATSQAHMANRTKEAKDV